MNTKEIHLPNFGIKKSIREITRNARVDWVIICIVSMVTIITLVTIAIHVYFDMTADEFVEHNTNISSEKTLNLDDFSKTVSILDNREEKVSKVKSSYNGLRDPSI